MWIRSVFMSSLKKKWYLQGKLLKSVYEEALKKQKDDPVGFCNRFAEQVGKETIRTQIESVDVQIAELESRIAEKKKEIATLEEQKKIRAEAIVQKYDEQLKLLRERKSVFLSVDREMLDGLVEQSRFLDSKVDAVAQLMQESGDSYKAVLAQNLNEQKTEIVQNISEQIKEDFCFPEIRELGKSLGFLLLFCLVLLLDFFLAYQVLSNFVGVGTSRALEVVLPFWIGTIHAEVIATVLTIMATMLPMLLLHFIPFEKEEIEGEMQYSRRTKLIYMVLAVFVFLWLGQSLADGGNLLHNVELIFRILFIPAMFVGDVILKKINRNALWDLTKKFYLIPARIQAYTGELIASKRINQLLWRDSLDKKNQEMSTLQEEHAQAQSKFAALLGKNEVESQNSTISEVEIMPIDAVLEQRDERWVMHEMRGLVSELKRVSDMIFSSYESEIRGYQDQLLKLENDKFDAIKMGTEEFDAKIIKIKEEEIPQLQWEVATYKQKINERIQEVSQGVLEGLMEK